MAYTDHRTGRNQRAAAMTIVAALQGAAIVALINGFAVQFIKSPPIPNPQARDIPITMPVPIPPPPQKRPPLDPQPRDVVRDPPAPLPGGRVMEFTLPPIDVPEITPIQLPEVIPPSRPPAPTATPRPARARNAPAAWATPADYPTRDLREGNQGVTAFTLAIGADGRVQSCTITRSSGFPGLDKATCDNVSRRARFEPASDGMGNRTVGSFSGSIRWQIPKD